MEACDVSRSIRGGVLLAILHKKKKKKKSYINIVGKTEVKSIIQFSKYTFTKGQGKWSSSTKHFTLTNFHKRRLLSIDKAVTTDFGCYFFNPSSTFIRDSLPRTVLGVVWNVWGSRCNRGSRPKA